MPLFYDVDVLYGFPEYKVPLLGGGASSQNDLYVLAKTNNELLTIMVEGKVSEPFEKISVRYRQKTVIHTKMDKLL